jgi:hypothetical protein
VEFRSAPIGTPKRMKLPLISGLKRIGKGFRFGADLQFRDDCRLMCGQASSAMHMKDRESPWRAAGVDNPSRQGLCRHPVASSKFST